MKKVRIGVICPADIAFRRFMPALSMDDRFVFMGVGVASVEERFGGGPINQDALDEDNKRANAFVETYGGRIFGSYTEMTISDEIDAVYLPLPPALHCIWAQKALENGKHVLIEKPATTDLEDTDHLIEIANEHGLALHENYMFMYHNQIAEIVKLLKSGCIGDVRLYRLSFGFPRRSANDFRYKKALGGGALLDCGGYTLKLADYLLGGEAEIVQASSNCLENEFDVDIYGCAVLVNKEGTAAQIAFGMDNSYKCELEIWGSKGSLYTGRVFTAPSDLETTIQINCGNACQEHHISPDDSFAKSIDVFYNGIFNSDVRMRDYETIRRQARLVEGFIRAAHMDR